MRLFSRSKKLTFAFLKYALLISMTVLVAWLIYCEQSAHVVERPARTSDFIWTNMSDHWRLYSAYIDERMLIGKPVVHKSIVLMGFEKKVQPKVLCIVQWRDSTRSILDGFAFRKMVEELWWRTNYEYRAYFYRCDITGIDKMPRYITLVEEQVAFNLNEIPKSRFIPVVAPETELLHEFGVCYQTPLFGNTYTQIVVDSIEMNRLLGATWFTFYVYDGPQWTIDVLKSYTKQGLLDGIYNWGVNQPEPKYMFGVVVGIQDCLYRNMYRVKYLAFCDMDEVITPLKHLNWPALMREVDKSDKQVYFTFRQVAFHTNHSNDNVTYTCPAGSANSVSYTIPRYLATHNRTVKPLRKWLQAKAILKPLYNTVIHIHQWAAFLAPGFKDELVPIDTALLQHFRIVDDPMYTKYNSQIDHSMDKYSEPLFRAVTKKICG